MSRPRSARPSRGSRSSLPVALAASAAIILTAFLTGAPVAGRSPVPDSSPVASPGAAASVAPSVDASPSPTPRVRPGPTLPPLDPLPRLDPAVARPLLGREVVGYLPYWMSTSGFGGAPPFDPATDPWIRDGRLTDLVLFSVGIRRDGALKLDEANARFVLSGAATRIIKDAHAHGIRVLVSFVSGGYANNAALFGDMRGPERFVTEAAALVALRGLDGADLDVELIKKPQFAEYAQTAGLLRTALQATNPAARVTVATNGARSGANMAAMALAQGADRAFLMGYAYRSGGSSPVGSIAPLHHPTDLDLLDSLDLYRAKGIDLSRVILGLPTYGMTWPTVGSLPNAQRAPSGTLGGGRVISFYDALTATPAFGARWDEVPGDPSARLSWWDPANGTWWQTYVDTPATWRPKLLLVLQAGLAGVGLWALGYEGGLQGYPDMVDEVFGRPVVEGGSIEPAVGTSLDVTVSTTALDVFAPTASIELSNDGVTWSAPLAPDAVVAIPWRLADGMDGDRTVLVRAQDTDGRVSVPYALHTTLDRQGPAITGPSLRPMDGGWRIGFAQTDLTGFAPVRVRDRVGDGPWTEWRTLRTAGDAFVATAEGAPVTVELEATDPLGNQSVASATAP